MVKQPEPAERPSRRTHTDIMSDPPDEDEWGSRALRSDPDPAGTVSRAEAELTLQLAELERLQQAVAVQEAVVRRARARLSQASAEARSRRGSEYDSSEGSFHV